MALEQANLERALQQLIQQGLVELSWLPGDNWRDLQKAMRTTAGPWHVVHFIGHGGFDERRGEGVPIWPMPIAAPMPSAPPN